MKKYALMLLLVIFALSSCEKVELADAEEEEEKQEIADDDDDFAIDKGSDEGDDDDATNINKKGKTPETALTVEEFINGDFEGGVYVKGYIIGDCTRSWKHNELAPPFTHPQALLIADDPDEENRDDVMSIKLKKGKMRNELNLVDHPDYHHRQLIIYGYPDIYLGLVGMSDYCTDWRVI